MSKRFPFQMPLELVMQGYAIRYMKKRDLPIIHEMYICGRWDELHVARHMPKDEKEVFLLGQSQRQHDAYLFSLPKAHFGILQHKGVPMGRLYLDFRKKEIRIVDINLMPAHRKKGLGGALLGEVIRMGDERGVATSIHVEKYNPALRLYRRLGFEVVSDEEVYWLLERPAKKVALPSMP